MTSGSSLWQMLGSLCDQRQSRVRHLRCLVASREDPMNHELPRCLAGCECITILLFLPACTDLADEREAGLRGGVRWNGGC